MCIKAPCENKEEISYKPFSNVDSAQTTINFFNDLSDSYSTNSNSRLVGGNRKEWKEFLKNLGQNVDHLFPDGMGMGDLEYVKKIDRLNCPINLIPQEASFDDVGLHAFLRQRLSYNTVDKHLRYARFMENHPVPVDFRNPSYENFIRHMDYREQIEQATPNALKHQWDTMRMFLRAYGIPKWDYKLPPIPKSHKRILPYPETVNKFFYHQYSKDLYENALYQYLFFHSFMIGWRVPSEIITMTVDDVIIEGKKGYITITETKKHKSQRTLIPEQSIMTSRVHKSFKNWIDHWRPKVENQYSGNALYLQSSGKPFTIRHLGNKLSKHGKQVWKYFQPYDIRHWCAVARLTKTKKETGKFDVYTVKNWLGHEEMQTTENYIRYAEQYYNQLPVDWIGCALKPTTAGKHSENVNKEKTNRTPFSGLLTRFSPRSEYGPAEI